MFSRLLFLIIAFAGLVYAPSAHALNYEPCELSIEEDVYWAVMDETVTLQFTMKGDGHHFPEGNVTMIFSDGHEMEIARGGKYIDDAEDIGCTAQVEFVKSSIVGNLSGKYKSWIYEHELSTLQDAEALFTDEAFCSRTILPYTETWLHESSNGERGETRLTKIENSSIWQTQFLNCNPVLENISFIYEAPSGMDIETYNRLLKQNAPFIDIPYAYGSDTFVFDKENYALIPFSNSGC